MISCQSKGLNPVERKEFKRVVTEVIKEEFDLGIRNDVPGANGKAQTGWKGLEIRLAEEVFSKN